MSVLFVSLLNIFPQVSFTYQTCLLDCLANRTVSHVNTTAIPNLGRLVLIYIRAVTPLDSLVLAFVCEVTPRMIGFFTERLRYRKAPN